MKRLTAIILVAIVLASCGDEFRRSSRRPPTTTTTVATTRAASADEANFCLAHLDTLGPITGDCNVVPVGGTLFEDDPWGRWDCRTMGNRTCGDGAGNLTIWFEVDGTLSGFDVDDPHRPGCFVEPSNTPEGYEVIFYSRISGRGPPEFIGDPLGFEVRCPR